MLFNVRRKRGPLDNLIASNRSALERNENGSSLNTYKPGNPYGGTLENSEDPDEMPQNVAFHQDLHCLLIKIKTIFRD